MPMLLLFCYSRRSFFFYYSRSNRVMNLYRTVFALYFLFGALGLFLASVTVSVGSLRLWSPFMNQLSMHEYIIHTQPHLSSLMDLWPRPKSLCRAKFVWNGNYLRFAMRQTHWIGMKSSRKIGARILLF